MSRRFAIFWITKKTERISTDVLKLVLFAADGTFIFVYLFIYLFVLTISWFTMRLHLSYSIQLLNPYVLSDLVPVVLFLFFFGLPSIWLLLFFWMKNNQNRRNHPEIEMKIFMISTKISGFLKEYWTVERNIRCHSII